MGVRHTTHSRNFLEVGGRNCCAASLSRLDVRLTHQPRVLVRNLCPSLCSPCRSSLLLHKQNIVEVQEDVDVFANIQSGVGFNRSLDYRARVRRSGNHGVCGFVCCRRRLLVGKLSSRGRRDADSICLFRFINHTMGDRGAMIASLPGKGYRAMH